MGVAPYKTFTFDGVSSADYDVYLTGVGVYNAPKRSVEMLSIAGRNGDYALDQGKFENIPVKYKVGMYDTDENDFATKVSNFRNWLCSKVGYVRLEDEYNPNEYRMAVYADGFELDHDMLIAGEAEITFNCKPQRWLTSGETAVTIGEWGETETVSGDVVEVEATDTDAVKSLVADIVPIQSGSGTPSPQNIRPISGHDEVGVSVCGKNLWLLNDTYIGSAGTLIANQNITLPKGTFELSFGGTLGGAMQFTFRKADLTNLAQVTMNSSTLVDGKYKASFTLAEPCEKVNVYSNNTYDINNIQIEVGSTATDYVPYNTDSTTYTTTLPSTTYGGTLDVVSGELTVTHGIVDMGDLTWYPNGATADGYQYYTPLSGKANGETNLLCSAYKVTTPSLVLGVIHGRANSSNVVCNTTQSTAAAFKTAVTGQKIVYELATPTTTTLTPQQIELLLGENNIWADSGDITLEYGHNPMVLVNPTPFEAEPLLAVDGYGTIGFNGYEVEIGNVPIGDIVLYGGGSSSSLVLDESNLNVGDTITVNANQNITNIKAVYTQSTAVHNVTPSISCSNSDFSVIYSGREGLSKTTTFTLTTILPSFTIVCGTNSSVTNTVSGTLNVSAYPIGYTLTFSYTQTFTYTASTHTLAHSVTGITISSNQAWCTPSLAVGKPKYDNIVGDSTKSAISDTVYIDCDIGECWTVQGGEIVSLNGVISLGSDLPKLSSGTNTFTYDNTVTELNVTPRYWKV